MKKIESSPALAHEYEINDAVRLLILGLDSSLGGAVFSVENVLSFDAEALKRSDQVSETQGSTGRTCVDFIVDSSLQGSEWSGCDVDIPTSWDRNYMTSKVGSLHFKIPGPVDPGASLIYSE